MRTKHKKTPTKLQVPDSGQEHIDCGGVFEVFNYLGVSYFVIFL